MNKSVWSAVILVAFFSLVLCQNREGDSCITKSGLQGTCLVITQCPYALNNINKGIFPTDRCGYRRGTQSLICCINNPGRVEYTPGVTARRKCREYAEYAYNKIISPVLSRRPSFSKSLECPIKTQTFIVGGTLAERREFPHMVQIGYVTGTETDWACGGSLISPIFVLTAAHCLQNQALGDAKLVRGGISNQTDLGHVQTRYVIDRIYYPQYKFEKYHDIGLLRLNSAFDLNTYLRPACLYTQKNIPYTTAVASGWGKTGYSEEGSNNLLKVILETFTNTKCNAIYKRQTQEESFLLPNGIDEDLMICYGSTTQVKDTCKGDSGGPLQVVHPDTPDIKCMYDIIGVTSFGVYCGIAQNLPGVYTRVSHYIQWLEDTVWPR